MPLVRRLSLPAAYLRRRLTRARAVQRVTGSVADLAGFAETFADLDDPNIMSRAWR